jgi:integrase
MNAIAFEAFRDGLLRLYERKESNASYLKFRQVLREFEEACKPTSTADLTTREVRRYLDSLSCNANSKRGYLDYVRTICRYAVDEGYLERMPSLKRIAPKPVPMSRNPVLTWDEVSRLLESLRERARDWKGRRLHALTAVIAHTGVRRTEALCLRLEDLDAGARLLRIVPRERPLKTAKSTRVIAVPHELLEMLEPWLRETGCKWMFPGVRRQGPWLNCDHRSRPLTQLQAAAAEAGLGRVTWHGLRHSFATIALTEWRVPLWVVSASLGHGSITTTERYLHPDPLLLARELAHATFARRPD